MLAEPEARAVINETFRILKHAVETYGRTSNNDNSPSVMHDIPPELTAALEQNTFIFSGFKTHHQLKEASLLLKDKNGGFKPYDKYERDVLKIHNTYNRQYLNAEYNYAVHSTQMAVKWKEFEKDGDKYYLQYRTAGDEKVRADHAALGGTTLPMDDPFWDSYLPPLGWNCRCTVVQTRKEKYPLSDSAQAIEAGNAATNTDKLKIFRFNPGKEMKVFPPKHPYLPKGCGNCTLKLAREMNDSEKCRVCRTINELQTNSAKKTREWAKLNIQGKTINHSQLSDIIHISGGGIKEFINQPHKHYFEKNKLMKDIINVIEQSEYKGVTKHKGRISHIFEIEIKGDKSWIIANENKGMGIRLYSITESDKVLIDIKK